MALSNILEDTQKWSMDPFLKLAKIINGNTIVAEIFTFNINVKPDIKPLNISEE